MVLMEKVFSHLPAKQLLKIGRTCKNFDTIIKTTPTVRHALWQRASSDATPTPGCGMARRSSGAKRPRNFMIAGGSPRSKEREVYQINTLLLKLHYGHHQHPVTFGKPEQAYAARLRTAVRNPPVSEPIIMSSL